MEEVKTEPEKPWRYKGPDLIEAEAMFEHIEMWDETAAKIVKFEGLYYTIYGD